MSKAEKIVLKDYGKETITLSDYVGGGGFTALQKALSHLAPAGVIKEIKRSGLRGRGGGGYPTWSKWETASQQSAEKKYVCCNAAESEPGTFKDRHLIKKNPYQIIEGIIIAAYAVGAREAYIFLKSSFEGEATILEKAIHEVHEAGYLGDNIMGSGFGVTLKLFRGPDNYLAGEETALLQAIEGKAAAPKQKPPYPSVTGLFGMPTVVNNVETLANVPHIITRGAEWFTGIGTDKSPGTMVFSLSGDVSRPGVYELPLGTPLSELIYTHGGGTKEGRKLKAVFPGGPSHSLLTEKEIGVALDYESLAKAGSGLGSGGAMVYDEMSCIVRTALGFSKFFMNEQCGQCPPCTMGTTNLTYYLQKIEDGQGTADMLDSLLKLCGFIRGKGYCTLVDGAAKSVQSTLRYFREDYLAHIDGKRCG